MALAAIRRANPSLSEDEVRLRFIAVTYGEALAHDVREWMQERRIAAVDAVAASRGGA